MPIQKSEIPLQVCALESDNYHLFIDVKIGRKKARLLVDTGASKTVFDAERFAAFVGSSHIQPETAESVGLGAEMVKTKLAELTVITIGTVKIKKPLVAVLSLSHVNDAYKMLGIQPVDGVLGSDLMLQLKAVISYKKQKLTVYT